jgi:general secretion pathway protein J
MDKRANRTGGFTLIELLVAITVLAIVAVLGWRGLDSIVRARVSLTGEMEQVRGMQLAFAQMQSDCAHIVNAAMVPGRAPLLVEPGRVIMVRTVLLDDQPSRLQVVAYEIRGGALTRRETEATRDLNTLDTLWLNVTGDANPNPPVVLQSGVQNMNLRVWVDDGKGWRAPDADAQDGSTSTTGTTGTATAASGVAATGPTGLEMALRLAGRAAPMTKVFLLGAV